jgi:high-affinity Fe2+/Pb2+ permease
MGVALSLRSRIEHASHPLMERFNALPRVVVLLVLLTLLAVGVLAPEPWSGLAFLVVSVFIGWLLYLTWPRLTLPERLMRFAVLALTVAVGIINLGFKV